MKAYKSKTIGAAVLNMAALKFVPGAKEWVAENPELYGEILGFAMVALRLITNRAIKWKKQS